jgi:cysteinyl-tRNA synthetase
MWLHNGFVTVGDENEKMSKSLGNFVTVHDLLQQIDDPMVLRFFMATTQYRRAIAYSTKNMAQAGQNLEHIRTGYRNLQFRLQDALEGDDEHITKQVNTHIAAFNAAMDDDFNAPNALTAIYELVDLANQYANAKVVYQQAVQFILDSLVTLMGVFGVDGLAQEELLDADIDALIKERDQARAAKNFARSDEIRDTLAKQAIILEDTPQGTRWHR